MATTVVDKAAVTDVSLAVLKRQDPEVEQVLGSAGHVCLYVMSVEAKAWERKNVEGSLFLLKRRSAPRFQIVVMNKLATENYVEPVHGGFEVEISSPYLMYTQGDGKVHGIWFYEEKDLEVIAGLVNKIKTGLPKPDIMPGAEQAEASVSAAPKDDGAFWDKQVEVPANPPPKPGFPGAEATASTSGGGATNNALTNLFKQAQLKQQAAQQHSAQPPAGASAVAAAPMPLPPSYFTQQGQAGAKPEDARRPPALSPAPSADYGTAAAAPRPAGQPGTAPAGENALQRLFNKSSAVQAPVPASAAPAAVPVQPQQPVQPVAQQQPNVLSQLLAGAAQKAASAVAAPRPAATAQPPTPTGAAAQSIPARPLLPRGPQQADALRAALARVVARPEFVDLLLEELRGVGLAQ